MYLVAVTDLAGRSPDPLLPALAAELGTTAYELRLTLNGGFPAVVLATVDEDKARGAFSAFTRAGLRAVLFDRRTLIPSTSMVPVRDFSLEPGALVPSSGSSERLEYADIVALVKATHRSVTHTTTEVKSKSFDPVRAVVTGGLLMSKKTTKEVTSSTEQRQQVLYLFPAAGTPFILRERDARFQGLGKDLRPTSLDNFVTTIRRLREAAPRAVYDERLLTPRPVRGVADGVDAADLLAYLVRDAVAVSRSA